MTKMQDILTLIVRLDESQRSVVKWDVLVLNVLTPTAAIWVGLQLYSTPVILSHWQQWSHWKWHMADRLVMWPMTSRVLERSWSWTRFTKCPLARKWFQIETRLQ